MRPANSTPGNVPRLSWRRKLTFSLIATLGLFFLLEGLCSTAVTIHDMWKEQPLAERVHTEYDAQLGWINRASFTAADMYGGGRSLTTNAQRFRSGHPFDRQVPAGKIRIMCSGDSFTLGYGVGDQDTWCAQLERLDPRLETVNLGQGGYGLDQAYLWYDRVQGDLGHQIHLMTFIAEDFRRMPNRDFNGYGKPVLELQEGQLQVTNVPVARTPYALSGLIRNGQGLRRLATVRVTQRLLLGREEVLDNQQVEAYGRRIAERIFQHLHEEHTRQGRILVLVYLPVRGDRSSKPSGWREFVRTKSLEQGWLFWDLTEELARLPEAEVANHFIGPEVEYRAAAGHYNEQGNRFIARALYDRLLGNPDTASRVNSAGPLPEGPSSQVPDHAQPVP